MSRPARTKPLILVAEDDSAGRELVVEILDIAGFATIEAQDGHEALEKADELVPDAIVVDWSMQGVDGVEVTRRLKASPRTEHIVILFLTGHVQHDDRARAVTAGCDAFLTKPCLPDVLVREVKRLLEAPSDDREFGGA